MSHQTDLVRAEGPTVVRKGPRGATAIVVLDPAGHAKHGELAAAGRGRRVGLVPSADLPALRRVVNHPDLILGQVDAETVTWDGPDPLPILCSTTGKGDHMATRDEVNTSHPIFRVHRIGAVVVAAVLWVFGILGFLGHPGFLSAQGTNVLGMTCNGLLATISLMMGAILIVAAVRVGPAASTAAVVIGALFVLSGLLNLIVLHRSVNYLAFTMPNVIFSLVVGIALLFVGLYGRASGQLPADNPFRAARGGANRLATVWHGESMTQEASVASPEEAERRLDEIDELAEAEHAMAEGTASPQQERDVIADSAARARERRRDNWRRAARERR